MDWGWGWRLRYVLEYIKRTVGLYTIDYLPSPWSVSMGRKK